MLEDTQIQAPFVWQRDLANLYVARPGICVADLGRTFVTSVENFPPLKYVVEGGAMIPMTNQLNAWYC